MLTPHMPLQMPRLPQVTSALPQPKVQQAVLPPRPLYYKNKIHLHLEPKGKNKQRLHKGLGPNDK